MSAGNPGRPEEDQPRGEEPLLISASMLAGPPQRGPVDFERGMRTAPPFVLVLIAANVAVFVWEATVGALESRETILAAGALARDPVLAGEWWRLASAMFLHGGIDHLLGNMIVLYIVGIACEHALGTLRTAFVYFAAGIAGSLLSMSMSPGPSVGASGAVFGITASLIVVLYRYQDLFHVRDKRIGFVLLIWAGYQMLSGLATPYIDNLGHLGGIAGGTLATLAVRPRLLRIGERGTLRP